jgi:hypothetical protein
MSTAALDPYRLPRSLEGCTLPYNEDYDWKEISFERDATPPVEAVPFTCDESAIASDDETLASLDETLATLDESSILDEFHIFNSYVTLNNGKQYQWEVVCHDANNELTPLEKLSLFNSIDLVIRKALGNSESFARYIRAKGRVSISEKEVVIKSGFTTKTREPNAFDRATIKGLLKPTSDDWSVGVTIKGYDE